MDDCIDLGAKSAYGFDVEDIAGFDRRIALIRCEIGGQDLVVCG